MAKLMIRLVLAMQFCVIAAVVFLALFFNVDDGCFNILAFNVIIIICHSSLFFLSSSLLHVIYVLCSTVDAYGREDVCVNDLIVR